ncbi:MAG: GNAT family N-acetyltransferase [bacterium]|nr:GNAT family N-acetyltransferase [bacterium]
METASPYRLERIVANRETLHRDAALLRAVFPHATHYTDDFLAWEYADNPDGPVVGYDAYRDGELCAHYATQPLTATLFGRSVRGLLSFNTATHPDHQGHGLFTTLARRTFDDAAREGYEFVVGVANQNSTPGFTRKLGFQLVGPLEVFVGLGAPHSGVGDGVDFARTWSTESRGWRLASPRTRYVLAGGRLACATDTPLIKALLTAGPWDGPQASTSFLLSHPFSVWMGAAPSLSWRGISLPLPKRLRPSPLNLIFLDLTGAGRTLDSKRVIFDAIDFDAY